MNEDIQGLKIHIGKPHPRYPSLLVEKINKRGDIKIKGMGRYRNPRYPYLMALTAEDHRRMREGMKEWKYGNLSVTSSMDKKVPKYLKPLTAEDHKILDRSIAYMKKHGTLGSTSSPQSSQSRPPKSRAS